MANDGQKKNLDDALEGHMSRFQVRKPVQSGSGPAIPTSRPKDESAKNPADGNPPQSGQETTPPAAENHDVSGKEALHVSASEDDGNSVMSLLPPEAVGKRQVSAIKREVDRWEAPKALGKVEERRFRNAACMARFVSAIDAASKYNLGSFLIDAKEKLKHGEFVKYLDVGCNLNKRTAQKYMKVAEAFPDARTVNIFGFEWCFEVASMDVPAEVMERILKAESRTQAEEIIGEWEDQKLIAAAWMSLFPNGDPITTLGRDLALELARSPFVREFRELVAESGADQAKALADRYKALLPQFLDGQAVVRAMRGHADEQPAGEEPIVAPKGVFRLKSLQTRLDSLTGLEGLDMDEEAQALAKRIEDQLLELTRLLQSKA